MHTQDLLDDLKRTTMRLATYAFFGGCALGFFGGAAITFFAMGGFQ